MQRKWRVTLIVCVGVFMASLDLFIVNIAFPYIAKDYKATSLASLSWILSGYAIVFAALLVPAGRWADAFGRKRAFLLGLGVFALASVACALAPSVGVLIGARLVQAAGGALMLPTSLGLMLPEFAPDERHAAIVSFDDGVKIVGHRGWQIRWHVDEIRVTLLTQPVCSELNAGGMSASAVGEKGAAVVPGHADQLFFATDNADPAHANRRRRRCENVVKHRAHCP